MTASLLQIISAIIGALNICSCFMGNDNFSHIIIRICLFSQLYPQSASKPMWPCVYSASFHHRCHGCFTNDTALYPWKQKSIPRQWACNQDDAPCFIGEGSQSPFIFRHTRCVGCLKSGCMVARKRLLAWKPFAFDICEFSKIDFKKVHYISPKKKM